MISHIDYLRSLEDSESVRDACIKYLQTSLIYFYPERPDIVERARQMANALGRHLEIPRLSWKYAWISALLGWDWLKRIQLRLRKIRSSLDRRWDKTLFYIQGGDIAGNSF